VIGVRVQDNPVDDLPFTSRSKPNTKASETPVPDPTAIHAVVVAAEFIMTIVMEARDPAISARQ